MIVGGVHIRAGLNYDLLSLHENPTSIIISPTKTTITMKLIIVFAFLASVALAAPQGDPKQATILKYENDNIGLHGYNFAYETSDGTSRQEQAELKNEGTENEALVVRGTISWVSPDGQQFTLNYVADENGFQPSGAHLPQA